MVKSVNDALFYWLEEFPIEELTTDESQTIVSEYRNGNIGVTEASNDLLELCKEEIQSWISQNKIFSVDLS